MMIFRDVDQNNDEWMDIRKGIPTASKFGTIMANYGKAFGDPAKEYALQLAIERVTGIKSENNYTNAHMERGHEQEPIARMLYENMHFIDVQRGGFFDCGAYGGSPDGLVGDDGVIEIKSVIAKTHYATLRRNAPDPAYMWQLVGHIDCTGRDWVDFVSYCAEFPPAKQLLVYRVHREEVLDKLEMLRTRRDDFIKLIDETVKAIED